MQCANCFKEKAAADFSSSGEQGLHRWCKECRCQDERRRRRDPKIRARHKHLSEHHRLYRAKQTVSQIRKRARKLSVSFDLDAEWVRDKFLTGRCELTGLSFNFQLDQRMMWPSIDRIEASGPYTKANCRAVLLAVNIAMQEWGLDAFLPIAEALVERQAMNRDSGYFDRRIDVELATVTPDAANDQIPSWAFAFKRWAHKEDTSSGEQIAASQTVRTADTSFSLRSDTQSRAIAPESHRFRHHGRIYEIVGITESKDRGDTLIFSCASRLDQSGARAPGGQV